MLRDITLKNFRTFDHFAFEGFTHVNLIVGKNNSGKTGLLEAVNLLLNQGSPYYLVESLRLRGERVSTDFLSDDDQRRFRTRRSFSIAHLFYGHTPLAFARDWNQSNMFDDVDHASRVRATALAISSKEDRAQTLSIRLAEKAPDHTDISERLDVSERVEATYDLVISYSGASVDDHITAREITVPVFADLSIFDGYARGPARVAPHLLIPTDRTSNVRLAEYWNAITLTPREDKVVEALQILEPSVDRISFTSQLTAPPDILVKLKGQSVPVPLGTMGGTA